MTRSPSPSRREFLERSLAGGLAWSLVPGSFLRSAETPDASHPSRISTFRFDVTPPPGHPLCGGWIRPVEAVDDSLECLGFVIEGQGRPIVVCSVDWTGLLNEAHVRWREALARAANTTPDRVAVHCVHQHDAPFACLDAQRLVEPHEGLSSIVDPAFFRTCLERAEKAVKKGLKGSRPLTHVASGQARVEKVASNRRIWRDENGIIKAMRSSRCADPELRARPEGLIDPWLKTVALYDGPKKVVACHYYATHPMSHYGDGRVSSDFAGLARKRRQQDEPDCLHIYFTGCAGNIAAGKYNDGSPENRPVLTDRVYRGIVESERDLTPREVRKISWKTLDVLPPPRADLSGENLRKLISDPEMAPSTRGRSAYMLSWLHRLEKKIPIPLSALDIEDCSLLHLPAECFVQYQLRAQREAPDRFVATAAYGDGGPWYIPTADEYPARGYEVSVAFCDPGVDPILGQAIGKLLS